MCDIVSLRLLMLCKSCFEATTVRHTVRPGGDGITDGNECVVLRQRSPLAVAALRWVVRARSKVAKQHITVCDTKRCHPDTVNDSYTPFTLASAAVKWMERTRHAE